MKVSIGLPVFNGEAFICNALNSLLGQDFEDFELIICDNASTDCTYKICQEYAQHDSRIRLYRNETNVGAAKNFARVYQLSCGPYFMWAAHDDEWAPQYIRRCLEMLELHPDAVLCCTEIVFTNQDGTPRTSWSYNNIDTQGMAIAARVETLISRMGWYAIYGLLRSEAVNKLDLTIDTYDGDVVLLLELLLQGHCLKVPEPLFFYRLPDQPKSEQDYLQAINPARVEAVTRKPQSDMAKHLLNVCLEAEIDWESKKQILNSFINILSQHNPVWFDDMAREQGVLLTDTAPLRQKRRFIREILGAQSPLQPDTTERIKRALVFFPHNPWPAKSGAHHRCLTILESLSDLGYEVTLVSSTLTTDVPWQAQSIDQLRIELDVQTLIYAGTPAEQQQIALAMRSCYSHPDLEGWDTMYITDGLRAFFRSVYDRLQPEVVMVSYTLWANLLNDSVFDHTYRVIDTLDLFTLNMKMSKSLATSAQSLQFAEILNEDFFLVRHLQTEVKEFTLLERFNCALAVAPTETQLMQKYTQRTQVVYLPITSAVFELKNAYTGSPVFVVGPNSFNEQGYLYFINRVLPIILQELPEFRLRVVGKPSAKFQPHEGVELLGYVPDLRLLYTDSRFAICPLIGGTGQQVKILEAMAHGVPVLALQNVAASSPIVHGTNGLVAANAEEFAEYAVQLFRDRALCCQFGQASRATIAERFSNRQLSTSLSKILVGASEQDDTITSENIVSQYVAFPDWSQDEEIVARAIMNLLKQWLVKTEDETAKLSFYAEHSSLETVNDCLTYVLTVLMMEEQITVSEQQTIEVIAPMPIVEWEKLLKGVRARVVLAQQNNLALLVSGAWQLPELRFR